MPQYLSTDPNADQTATPKYLSTDPNADQPKPAGHPLLAGLARLAGGVGSALTQPAELSGVGAAIPAGIAGLGEAAAEKLEGGSWDAPLDAKRIGMESALGAVPFGYLTKGKMLGGMLKSGAISGVGEAGREWAKGEPLSAGSIVGQSALGAGTFGLLSRIFHGTPPAGPSGPAVADAPLVTQEAGNNVYRMPPDWTQRVNPATAMGDVNIAPEAQAGVKASITGQIAKANAPRQAPSVGGQSNFGNAVRNDLSKAIDNEPGAADMLGDLDKGIAGAQKIGSQNRAANFRAESQAVRGENSADLQEIKRVLGLRKADDLQAQLADSGLEPNTTFDKSESGVDAQGRTITKRTSYTPSDEEGGGGELGDAVPENPLDALARRLGMDTAHDPYATQRAIFGGAKEPEIPTGAAIENLRPGLELPESELPSVRTVPRDPGAIIEPPVEPQTPQSPVSALADALNPRRSRSLKTVQGFQDALQKRIEAGGEPMVPNEPNAAPGANVAPVEPVPALVAAGPLPPKIPGAGNLLANVDVADVNPESPIATKTHSGAAYRIAKDAFGRGEISAEDLANTRDAHLATLGRSPEGIAGLKLPPTRPTPTGIMSELNATLGLSGEQPPVAPIEGGMAEVLPTGNPDTGASLADDAPDWVKKQSQAADDAAALERERADPSQRGAANIDLIKRLLMPIAGAAVGAPIGHYIDPDDPNAGIKGAVAGGMLGAAGSGGPQGLINWRNAGLLATPSAQLKKPLSDIGAYVGKMGEAALSGHAQDVSAPMLREMFNPENLRNYARAFKNPALAEDVIGDTAKPYLEPAKGLLGLIARPFAAAQYATSQAMQRAGVTPDEAKDTLLLGTPQTQLAQKWLDLQKLPGWQGQAVRAIRPFARIGTNLFERGVQRIPGPSMFTGDPETRVARTLLGSGAVAAGMATGAGDANTEESGGDETSPLIRGLRRALLASYGIPFMAGEALTGPAGIRDLVYATPGATQTVPPPAPKDTFFSYGKKFGKRWLDQMMPDWATPADWTASPQR